MILLCCASELGLPEDLSAIEVILYYYYYYYFTLEKDQSRLNSRKCAFSNQRSKDHKQVELSFI